jgi:hypothetical protein
MLVRCMVAVNIIKFLNIHGNPLSFTAGVAILVALILHCKAVLSKFDKRLPYDTHLAARLRDLPAPPSLPKVRKKRRPYHFTT